MLDHFTVNIESCFEEVNECVSPIRVQFNKKI